MNGTSSQHEFNSDPPPSEEVTLVTLDARLDKVEAWQVKATPILATVKEDGESVKAAVATGFMNSTEYKVVKDILIGLLIAWAASKGLHVGGQ
jgi:hypothetical protein